MDLKNIRRGEDYEEEEEEEDENGCGFVGVFTQRYLWVDIDFDFVVFV